MLACVECNPGSSYTVMHCIAQQVMGLQLVIAFCRLTASHNLNSSSVHCALALAHDALHEQSTYQNSKPAVYAGHNVLARMWDMQRLGRGCLSTDLMHR